MEIEKLNLESLNVIENQKAKLKELFPEVFTEGEKIDFDKLRLTLGETVDIGKERYGMNWPGKSDCFKIIQQPSRATLIPVREESVNFDDTENLFIEGDNLEVLKLLQKSYFGKVKMIYIDPPYNTGNEFVYPDDFADSLTNYLELTGQIDTEGRRISTNQESNGRYHSNWLNMMYPRLFTAKNLLKDDGVIFISIDGNEVDNLKKLCNDIFGEENFIECFIWRSRLGKGATSKKTATIHEYIICYAKNINLVELEPDRRIAERKGKERIRQWGQGDRRIDRPTMFYPVLSEEYGEVYPIKADGTEGRWRIGPSKFDELQKNNLVLFEKQTDGRIEAYRIIPEGTETETAQDSILKSELVKTTATGTKEVTELFQFKIFDYPKPTKLIMFLINICTANGLILDFFSGSATTANAVMQLNTEDGGNRKFIMVQLPEPCDEMSEAYNAGYKTIADIGKERIRKVINNIKLDIGKNQKEDKKTLFEPEEEHNELDLGFKVFKLSESNFTSWNSNIEKTPEAITEELFKNISHISESATQESILYEILLKSGFMLTTTVEKLNIAEKNVYSIENGAMLICLEENLNLELFKEMAKLKPSRIIVLDSGFNGSDELKVNAIQTIKSATNESEEQIIFRTV